MYLANILPPIAMPAIALFAFFALLLFIVEARRSRGTTQTKRLIMQHVRTSATKQVSVIVELNRRADTLLPLLEHLYSHDYRKLEVIVIVKQTAGSKAKSALASYRRKQSWARLRIVTHRKGLTVEQCAQKYATGELVLHLEPADRLGPDFFSFASFHFIDSELNVLVPQQSPQLDQTIMSAVRASGALFSDSWATISRSAVPGISSQLPLRVVTRKRWLSKKSYQKNSQIYSSQLFVTTNKDSLSQLFVGQEKQTTSWSLRIAITVWLLAAGLLLTSITLSSSVWFALSVLLLGYCAALIALIIGSRSYGLWEKLNLILFSPFSLCGFALLTARKAWTNLAKRRHYRVNWSVLWHTLKA